MNIRPQAGPQEVFLSTSADIAIYGGAAGGGKTYALLLENLRHINNPAFGSVVFRRESVQITNEGGLWDTAMGIYPLLGAKPRNQPKMQMIFESGAKITFSHLQLDRDVLGWQGSQIPLIAFDELTHFTKTQFFYMLSRNRSTCGIKPYVRATTNPDAESWVAELISWWIDQDTGYAIPERSGVIRYFTRQEDQIIWSDSREELSERLKINPDEIKSFTFISASIFDNKILLESDPGYLSNLKALSRVENERLEKGNWKVKPSSGMYFKRHEVELIDFLPKDIDFTVRAWDLAASEPNEANPNPDYTAGIKMGRRKNGNIVIMDVINEQYKAAKVRETILNTAKNDSAYVKISIPQDPGQAGKEQAQSYVKLLLGFSVKTSLESGDKVTRAEPFAAQWQAGNIEVLRAPWNEMYFSQLEGFPVIAKKDMVDASSRAFAEIAAKGVQIENPENYIVGA